MGPGSCGCSSSIIEASIREHPKHNRGVCLGRDQTWCGQSLSRSCEQRSTTALQRGSLSVKSAMKTSPTKKKLNAKRHAHKKHVPAKATTMNDNARTIPNLLAGKHLMWEDLRHGSSVRQVRRTINYPSQSTSFSTHNPIHLIIFKPTLFNIRAGGVF